MNKLNLLALTTSCLLALSPQISQASPNTCAKIATKVVFLGKEEVALGLLTHNGKRINVPRTSKDQRLADQGITKTMPMTLALAPGYHEFTATILADSQSINMPGYTSPAYADSRDDSSFKHYPTFNSHQLSHYALRFGIEVEAQTIYRVVGKRAMPRTLKVGQQYQAIIKSEKATQCDASKIRPAMVKDTMVTFERQLPDELLFRLDALTKDIQAHYQQVATTSKTPQDNVAFMLPSRKEQNFGIIAATDTPVSDGMLLLGVAPLTSASMLGLKSDDRIIAINGQALTNEQTINDAFAKFRQQLQQVGYGEEISIDVIRDGTKVALKSEYPAISLPEVRMTIKLQQ